MNPISTWSAGMPATPVWQTGPPESRMTGWLREDGQRIIETPTSLYPASEPLWAECEEFSKVFAD
jgi:hypothetical protein